MTKRCRGLVAMLGVLAVFVTNRTADVFAISLENDVDVSWSNLGGCPPGQCKIQVFGAPRMVQRASSELAPTKEDLRGLRIVISKGDGQVDFLSVKLLLKFIGTPVTYTFTFVQMDDPSHRTFFQKYDNGVLSVDDFETEEFPFGFHVLELTFVVEGKFITVPRNMGAPPVIELPKVIVSGIGNEVRVDTVGDFENFHPGDVQDIPPRSLNIVRALNELASVGIRAVELDAAPRFGAKLERTTSLTHLFKPASIARIQSAELELCVASDPFHSNDLVLLDQGIRDVARGQSGVQVIRFSDVSPSENMRCGVGSHGFRLTIDLAAVPTTFSYPPPDHSHVVTPPGTHNLLRELGDGRLNVIIVGQTSLDYSKLTIVFRNDEG
jgi:hypothetical protein